MGRVGRERLRWVGHVGVAARTQEARAKLLGMMDDFQMQTTSDANLKPPVSLFLVSMVCAFCSLDFLLKITSSTHPRDLLSHWPPRDVLKARGNQTRGAYHRPAFCSCVLCRPTLLLKGFFQ
jgi:hypothetical protein